MKITSAKPVRPSGRKSDTRQTVSYRQNKLNKYLRFYCSVFFPTVFLGNGFLGTAFVGSAFLCFPLPCLAERFAVRDTDRIVVVVATANIPKGSVIKDQNLQEQTICAGKTPADLIHCRINAVGFKAKYGIAEGQLICIHDLQPGIKKFFSNDNKHTNCSQPIVPASRKIPAADYVKPDNSNAILKTSKSIRAHK